MLLFFRGALIILAIYVQPLYAAISYIEGEPMMPAFSSDYQAPTMLTLGIGENQIAGSIVDGDPDFYTLTVPKGAVLTTINLDAYGHGLASNVSFIGYQIGMSIDRDPETLTVDDINYTLFGINDVGGAILEGENLVAGDYAFWINETSSNGAVYSLNYTVVSVPEPSTFSLVLLAAIPAIFYRYEKR